jgi:hypothetical protein
VYNIGSPQLPREINFVYESKGYLAPQMVLWRQRVADVGKAGIDEPQALATREQIPISPTITSTGRSMPLAVIMWPAGSALAYSIGTFIQ